MKGYHTGRWHTIRRVVMALYGNVDPWAFQKHGAIIHPDTVHHIIPTKERPDLFWSYDNLIPLSRESHAEVHALYAASPEDKAATIAQLRSLVRTPDDG